MSPLRTRTISPVELYGIYQGGKTVELIDVRTPAEFRAVHAAIARPEPLEALDPKTVIANRALRDEPLYVICRSGSRAQKACDAFAAAGYGDRVVNVEGGTLGWEQAGLPIVRGKSIISLERQLRIVIGTLVLLGTVLGAFVSPWFLLLAGFCGAGLVFAGITDICPMAMTLARMPWNQVKAGVPGCQRRTT
jgi:rhodanese-related sulfurtransferase